MNHTIQAVCYIVTDHNGHRVDQSKPFLYNNRTACNEAFQEIIGQYPPKDFYHFIADYKEPAQG